MWLGSFGLMIYVGGISCDYTAAHRIKFLVAQVYRTDMHLNHLL
jgi:hypothetical protein